MTPTPTPTPATSARDRKAAMRARDRAAGWTEITCKVPTSHVDAVRGFVASLPEPRPRSNNPDQGVLPFGGAHV